jgi:REP element-mobilizing transposase RayT
MIEITDMEAVFEKPSTIDINDFNPGVFVDSSVDVDQKLLDTSKKNDVLDDVASATGNSEEQIVFEPLLSDLYELSYTCLLIPRFSSHFLMGDIAENLRSWMEKICISFGWKLDFLIIKADYLEWAMHVPPTTSPGYCIHLFRQHLSTDIFSEHPRFKRENISNDFWAPGHIVLVGSRPLPEEIIQRFIQTTRRQQA